MNTSLAPSESVRVLFVDDSRIQRGLWTRLLSQSAEITVVGAIESAEEILPALASLSPDVIVLDVNLPGLSGVEFLEQSDRKELPPCIILSAFVRGATELRDRALAAGAASIISKPQHGSPSEIKDVFDTVRSAILDLHFGGDRSARSSDDFCVQVPEFGVRPPSVTPGLVHTKASAPLIQRAIVIGSSTGGPAALATILQALSRPHPPVLIAQHISSKFTRSLAKSLGEQTGLHVVEVRTGDAIKASTVYVAPGNRHMRVRLANGIAMLMTVGDLPNMHHCPSIDELMTSAVEVFGSNALGMILTGMGNDGATGLLAMRRAGCRTLAQDEASSTIFGMPRAAIERGGVDQVGPPSMLIDEMRRWMRASNAD
jgi:two-component system chemotaxis response regulator CheB